MRSFPGESVLRVRLSKSLNKVGRSDHWSQRLLRCQPARQAVNAVLLAAAGVFLGGGSAQADNASETRSFVQQHCLDCHQGADAKAGFQLDRLEFNLADQDSFDRWVQVYDRVRQGEMPPPDGPNVTESAARAFADRLEADLTRTDLQRQQTEGRVTLRRLNRTEYEYTLRDLLELPELEVANMLPADGQAHGFDNVAVALHLSSVQLARYLEAAQFAIDEAMVCTPRPGTFKHHYPASTGGRWGALIRKGREAVQFGDAVGLLRQPNTAQAPWIWRQFKPTVAGRYRIRMKTFGMIWDRGQVLPADRTHVVSFYAFRGSTKRPLAVFDVPRSQDTARIVEFTTHLVPGDSLEIRFETLDDDNKPGRLAIQDYTADGVAIEWLETEGPLIDAWPPASYRRVLGELPSVRWSPASGLREPPLPFITVGNGKRAQRVQAKRNKITLYQVVSPNPQQDARRLLHAFAQRAFRRPVEQAELIEFWSLVQDKLQQQYCFQDALQIGYRAVLCATEFLFLEAEPGPLDDYALAARLSYFLWKSMPDAQLLKLAERGELKQPRVLRGQVERLLNDPKSQRFVDDFTGQWLDLRSISVTQPDEQLYPEFDRLLLDSMVQETRAYFSAMLEHDLAAAHVVDSDFVMINGRLAEHYGIGGVEGSEIRRVDLPEMNPRGGFITQASILKVTANGTTTSPVTRGVWMLERLLGRPVPPPPPNIGAIEPDLRGTITIRDQLDQHRAVESCAVCHRSIDPPGFALEAFDVIGGWRTRYRSLDEGDPAGAVSPRGRPVKYKLGLPVDTSGQAPGGERFDDIRGLRQILLADPEQLARNLVEKLMTYATGGGVTFADRVALRRILENSRQREYGLRTLIHEVVQSDPFRNQ